MRVIVEEILSIVRFLIAIAVFVVSAVLLGIGITQKVFFSDPEFVTLETTVETDAPYLVVDAKILKAHDGVASIVVNGGEQNFVGYGRTADVLAWIGNDQFETVGYSKTDDKIALKQGENEASVSDPAEQAPAATSEQTITNPAGSDLWLDEKSGEKAVTLPITTTRGMSVIIASNGVDSAPDSLAIRWPVPSRVPYATAFILAGGILALVGLVLYFLALRHMRKQQGPRRRGPKPPKLEQSRPRTLALPSKGRRSLRGGSAYVATGLAAALALGLTSCSPYETGQGAATPTPTATDTPIDETLIPAVTEAQMMRIISRASTTIAEADAAMDPAIAATRLTGPALEIRSANYAIRKADSAQPALAPVPASPVTLVMPQATDTWPRIVMAVVQNENDPTVPTTGIVMVQNSVRENYHMEYVVNLEPKVEVPEIAPVTAGSTLVLPDSKLLLIAPDELALAYGDVLVNDTASVYAGLFDLTTDTLLPQVGKAYKDQKKAAVAERASLEFTQNVGTGDPLALSTLNSGAIVAVGLNEVETVKPTQAGATVNPEGQAKALSGQTASSTGIESTYGLQLVFYVPPLGSDEKIVLLGYSQGLIAAKAL